MSRIVIPPAYSETIMSDRPPRRRSPLGTSRGSKLPLRSRGVARSISPTSLPSLQHPFHQLRQKPALTGQLDPALVHLRHQLIQKAGLDQPVHRLLSLAPWKPILSPTPRHSIHPVPSLP